MVQPSVDNISQFSKPPSGMLSPQLHASDGLNAIRLKHNTSQKIVKENSRLNFKKYSENLNGGASQSLSAFEDPNVELEDNEELDYAAGEELEGIDMNVEIANNVNQ